MPKALPLTFIAATVLLLAAALHHTVIAMPFAAARTATEPPQALDAMPVQNARLVCGWWGHFECWRVCPVAHRSHHRYYRYGCQPVVLGLPWI